MRRKGLRGGRWKEMMLRAGGEEIWVRDKIINEKSRALQGKMCG